MDRETGDIHCTGIAYSGVLEGLTRGMWSIFHFLRHGRRSIRRKSSLTLGFSFNSRVIFIGIIGITNDTNFIEILDSIIISSLRKFDIVFPPYDANQLNLIFRYRAIAFKEGVLTNSVIPLCSAYSAQEHGDEREV